MELLENQEPQEVVTTGTKIKVIAALLVVGFAAYVAYWIQEPVEVRTDILAAGSSMQTDMGAVALQGADTQATTQQASTTQQVSIANFAFDPATLNVDKGTTVVWTNQDNVPHNVVGDTFSSPTLNPGQSFSYTFTTEGSFTYKCTFHPQMKGYVIVGNPTGNPLPEALFTATETQAGAEQIVPSDAAQQDLHNAARPLSSSLSNVPEQLAGQQTLNAEAQLQAQAAAQAKGKLANSGPEDYLYAAIFGIVLFLNRKKLRGLQKSQKSLR